MMNKKSLLIGTISLLSLVSSCSTNTNQDTLTPVTPSYDGGLEGNEANDDFNVQNNTDIETLLESAATKTKYSYEVTVNVGSTQEQFTQYFSPNAWYSEYGDSRDFGYAQTLEEQYVFKYYINDDATEVYPSVYEYSGYYENSILTELYSVITIANINMLNSTLDSLKDGGYQYLGGNKFTVTDGETLSVFQYMTTYGSSITDYIVAFYIQIIDLESTIFQATIDLGSYGTIVGKFTPLDSTKIDFVNDAVINDGLKGVETQEIVADGSEKLNLNNFTMSGITLVESNGYKHNPTSTIYCTNDYFVCDYFDENYDDFGFAFIKANTVIPLYSETETGISDTYSEMSVSYDSCYEFKFDSNGNPKFIKFIGPLETDTTKYLYVDSLPAAGDTSIIYITKDSNGDMKAYVYEEDNGEGSWKEYSDWYECVGEFYVFNSGATFYPACNAFTALAPSLFEKADPSDDSETNFITTNSDITSALASGIFGWGFQETTTWMDYITDAYMDINLDSDNNIESIDLGLGIEATLNGHTGIQKVYYNYSKFGETSVASVETLLSSLYED